MDYDFSGYATVNGLLCSDGRTIMRDAFAHQDQTTVPLVWNHQHDDPMNVLGEVKLENRPEGVYCYGSFNDTERAQHSKELIKHGDIVALSIYANHLKHVGTYVKHGDIREVSLVLAGANPGACIDTVMMHSDSDDNNDETAIIYTGKKLELNENKSSNDTLEHGEEQTMGNEENKPATGEKTVADVVKTLNNEQKEVVDFLVGQAYEEGLDAGQDQNGGEEVQHNAFEDYGVYGQSGPDLDDVLTHDDMKEIIDDAKRYGSLKESVLAHGITNIEYLFPDDVNLDREPQLYSRDMGWVQTVMNGVHHTPFSRIRTTIADITADEARAKGYKKGHKKTEEVFGLLKRKTEPTTVYKKQKLDRDDMVDINDFNVVAYLKKEMRIMLDEEIARAVLVGDGRDAMNEDKISETNIRPVWTDDELYSVHELVKPTNDAGEAILKPTKSQMAREFIDQNVRAMTQYQGSGNTTMYISKELLCECLLLKTKNGERMYKNVDELATAMMVKRIVEVPVFSGLQRTVDSEDTPKRKLMSITFDLTDYNVGADKGGSVNMFDDFDIDYNQYKYLIETRCSGALTKPKAAVVLEQDATVAA